MAFLDEIKDRLGFGANEEEEFDEELYGEDYDEYAEEFENDYENGESADSGYAGFNPVSPRSSSRRGRSSSRSTAGRTSGPQLVSIDDVRSTTRVPDSLQRDPLPPRRGDNNGRNSVGRASDFALSGSEAGSAASSPSRSAGFNSLFDENTSTQAAATQSASTADAGVQPASSGYDPYRVYEAGGATSHKPTRSISVISPVSYNEVENVARMLRAGDAVVLTLRNTPSQLSKRILDFSFGVASALDATVDCIADKVFAITRVSNLNEDELARLRNQGVI